MAVEARHMNLLPPQLITNSNESVEFWEQPDGLGYKPCLDFSPEYRRTSDVMVRDRTKYLLVVVSGGISQQRNQIVDAVVIARVLGAALVVPILQVNVIWGDESEFSDIFDLGHFKSVLENDVRIVSSLPSTHIMTRPVEEKQTPLHVSPQWIRARYLKMIKMEGVLLLRGLDSRLSKDLPSDLQKLRCKVAFQALKFAPPIVELGNKLAQRMQSKGPCLALHLRMEKDVWVRTGCLPGLSKEYDKLIRNERRRRPKLLNARSNMKTNQGSGNIYCPRMDSRVPLVVDSMQPDSQLFPLYQSLVSDPISAKTSINGADSGLTYNMNILVSASRKRPRDSFINGFDSYHVSQKNKLSGVSPVLDDAIFCQIQLQQEEIERFIAEHTEKVRYELEGCRKRESRMLITAIQEGAMKKLMEKDEEMQRMGKLNWILQERVKSLYVENQLRRKMKRCKYRWRLVLRESRENQMALSLVC